MSARMTASLMALAVASVVVGCGGGSVNQENYAKINTGMSLSDVEAILGKGTEQSTSSTEGMSVGDMTIPGMSAKGVVWKDGNRAITVGLINGKVVSKAKAGF